jgi:hypothetical protein
MAVGEKTDTAFVELDPQELLNIIADAESRVQSEFRGRGAAVVTTAQEAFLHDYGVAVAKSVQKALGTKNGSQDDPSAK